MKQFNGLLKSEIAKAEKISGGKVTGYSWDGEDSLRFVTVRCEICTGYGSSSERLDDVILNVFMSDRRKSFASKCF